MDNSLSVLSVVSQKLLSKNKDRKITFQLHQSELCGNDAAISPEKNGSEISIPVRYSVARQISKDDASTVFHKKNNNVLH